MQRVSACLPPPPIQSAAAGRRSAAPFFAASSDGFLLTRPVIPGVLGQPSACPYQLLLRARQRLGRSRRNRSASQLIASSPPSYRDHPFHYAISYSIHVVMYINDNEGIVWHNLQPLAQTEPFL